MKNTSKEQEAKRAYDKIFKLIEKSKDIINEDVFDVKYKAEQHLFKLKIEDFGIDVPINRFSYKDYVNLEYNGNISIGYWGEKYKRTISWSDDGSQPDDELLYKLGFSTGAYILGSEYYPTLFQKMFEELKNFGHKYIDTSNHSLYFTMEKAKDIHEAYPEILKKYRAEYQPYANKLKAEKLRRELESLEA
jgi:hypothetical protein